MSLKKCFQAGQLKNVTPDLALAKKSLLRGKNILNEVKKLQKQNFIEVSEQRLYQAYFHMFKALLYKDGVKERSHYCTILYVKEKYQPKLNSYVEIIEILKDLRNQSQYGVEEVYREEEEIKNWLQDAHALSYLIEEQLS